MTSHMTSKLTSVCLNLQRFSLGLEKWDGIFQSGKSQGILNRLEKSGKITQNTGKLKGFHNKIYLLFVSDI